MSTHNLMNCGTKDLILMLVTTILLLSKTLWFRPLSDNIPEDFWYQVPQESNAVDVSTPKAEHQKARDIKHVFASGSLEMVIFWGSQSGRAEMLARRMSKHLRDCYGMKVRAASLSDYNFASLHELTSSGFCTFILSTYGDGEPPDNTGDFLHTLSRMDACLNSIRYLIFGLGNSNYRQYNKVAEDVDQLLQKLGAGRIGGMGRGDDADGSTDDAFSAWITACGEVLEARFGLKKKVASYRPSFDMRIDDSSKDAVITTPTSAQRSGAQYLRIIGIRKLWEDDSRVCLHVDLDLRNQPLLKYKTGDHVAIWACNPDSAVERLLSFLDLEGSPDDRICIRGYGDGVTGIEETHVPSPTTVRTLLRHHLEICAPVSRDVVAQLAMFAPSDLVREAISRMTSNPSVFTSEVSAPHATLGDVLYCLRNGGTWKIPVSFLLETLKPMAPRHYSICSSPIVQPRKISFAAVVQKPRPPVDSKGDILPQGCYGLTTNYLREMEHKISEHGKDEPAVLEICGAVHASSFKMPAKMSTPIIMIGAGTGVAPYRAFIQERVQRRALGQTVSKTLLFMGFRYPSVHLIYKDDWTTWKDQLGTDIFHYWTASSRDISMPKMYAHDRLRENGAEVMELLCNGSDCHLYVCGSSSLARSVATTLVELKMGHTGCGEEEALSWIGAMRASKRYQEEAWG